MIPAFSFQLAAVSSLVLIVCISCYTVLLETGNRPLTVSIAATTSPASGAAFGIAMELHALSLGACAPTAPATLRGGLLATAGVLAIFMTGHPVWRWATHTGALLVHTALALLVVLGWSPVRGAVLWGLLLAWLVLSLVAAAAVWLPEGLGSPWGTCGAAACEVAAASALVQFQVLALGAAGDAPRKEPGGEDTL